ncbi:MAG: DUF2752 domain-containing protein [Phycisphaerae bacterium]|jgi:hypothetical protein
MDEPTSASAPAVPARRKATSAGRAIAGLVLLACTGILGLAAYLKPDARGYGTHQRLGFAPCGFLLKTGYPCPTCGMTTAFSYAVRGRLVSAFLAQPAGLGLALATVLAGAGAIWVLVAGRLPSRLRVEPSPHLLFWGLLLFMLGGWAFKLILGLADGSLPLHSVRVSP